MTAISGFSNVDDSMRSRCGPPSARDRIASSWEEHAQCVQCEMQPPTMHCIQTTDAHIWESASNLFVEPDTVHRIHQHLSDQAGKLKVGKTGQFKVCREPRRYST